jgi:hypothetical protein
MEISQGNSLCSHLYLKLEKKSCFSFHLFSSAKLENKREEEILPREEGWHQWERGGGRKRGYEGEYCAINVYTCM